MRILLYRDDKYNFYSTIVDDFLFESALTRDQVEDYIKAEYGEHSLESYKQTFERCHAKGTSSTIDINIEDTILSNVSDNGQFMPYEECLERYL